MEERFWSLVSLRLAGEASPEELDELEELLRQNPQWGLQLQLFTNLWQQRSPAASDKKAAFSRHLQRLSLQQEEIPAPPAAELVTPSTAELVTPPAAEPATPPTVEPAVPSGRRRLLLPGLLAAAAITILFFFIYLYKGPAAQGFNTVSTRPGSRSKIQLPDGTEVWLNADSRLTYKINPASATREVSLTGEAYFDVAKDRDHPFIIHASAVDIKVLGTIFNVRAYGNDDATETDLIQGSVEVALRDNPNKKIVLQPSEKLVVQNHVVGDRDTTAARGKILTLEKLRYSAADSSYREISWMKNQLYFDDLPLGAVALLIERWYDVKVTIADEGLRTMHLSGRFEDESLSGVMEALQVTGGFRYAIRKKEVVIMH